MVTLDTYLSSIRNLPSLPTTYVELKKTCDNPRKGADDIASVISNDQSLATRLLQMANSAFYGFPRKVETVSDAVGKIGITQIQSLVLATSVMDSFKFISPHVLDMKRFWKHSLSCAVAAGLLARKESLGVDPETLFVGGLLHDIGRLVIYLKTPAEAKKLIEHCLEERTLEVPTEVKYFGFDHAQIGAGLIEKWNLPRTLVDMVRHHHAPSHAKENQRIVYLVHVADFVVSGLRMGDSGEIFVAPLDVTHHFKFPLAPQDIAQLVSEIEVDTKQLFDIFCK
ncbi:MAG: HDOD domain-containing protein [Verrucomicrobiota bacterium]